MLQTLHSALPMGELPLPLTTTTTTLWQVGPYKFVFQAEAPDPRRIPTHDILGVTVILLSCFYHEKVCAWREHDVSIA